MVQIKDCEGILLKKKKDLIFFPCAQSGVSVGNIFHLMLDKEGGKRETWEYANTHKAVMLATVPGKGSATVKKCNKINLL